MEWIDRWDIVLLLVAGYVAVMALVRLMARRRDHDVAEVERQMESFRNQTKKKRGGRKGRDAA
jgi:hypothetical protein